MQRYVYEIGVLVKCERCGNSYIRQDMLNSHDKMYPYEFNSFYKDFYDGKSNNELTFCVRCNGFMFEEKVVSLKETMEIC